MKKIPEKLQRLSRRAAELRETLENVPAKITEIRATVASATANVQKLRAEVQSSVATLRAETDTQLVATLREIDGATDEIAAAGCELARVDLDLGPARKLVVHLVRAAEVDADTVRRLLAEQKSRPAIHALLTALLKADELAASVELEHLTHTKLTVEIGLVPSVRVGWEVNDARATPPQPMIAASAVEHPEVASPVSSKPAAGGMLGQSAFFERRVNPPAAVATSASESDATPDVSAERGSSIGKETPAGTTPPTSDWRRSALDRFKKMPDLTRRSH